MVAWVAISYGALDVRGLTGFSDGVEVLVTPIMPAEPLALFGTGAALWQRLVSEGPVDDGALDEHERDIVREMAQVGLASTDPEHSARRRALSTPWLSSPLHELVYALVASVAREVGVDAVFIKGPMLHAQGLREREHSGDVDVWVDPAQLPRVLRAFEPWGWTQEPDIWGREPINHSLTLLPGSWGCEIDVHRRMPGLTLDDAEAFAALRAQAEEAVFAGVEVRVPKLAASAALSAVHMLRPEIGRLPVADRTDQVSLLLSVVGTDAVDAAICLGAVTVLRTALEQQFPGRRDELPHGGTPRDWAWRRQSSKPRAYLVALGQVRWWRRPVMLLRLLWPSRAVARTSAHKAGEEGAATRMQRLRRGIRALLP